MLTTPRSADVLLVQPRDDGLEMYVTCLRYHSLTVIGASDAWNALIVAPKTVIVTDMLLAGSMEGVELIARLRRDERTRSSDMPTVYSWTWVRAALV